MVPERLSGSKPDLYYQVDHAAFDEDYFLDYHAFLDAFQVVDTGSPTKAQEGEEKA